MRNNYAPGSHDWFVPNTLLHLNTNLFNYISLFYYISLLIILAYCLLPIAYAKPMHSAADAFGGPPEWRAEGRGGGDPQRGPGPGGERLRGQ